MRKQPVSSQVGLFLINRYLQIEEIHGIRIINAKLTGSVLILLSSNPREILHLTTSSAGHSFVRSTDGFSRRAFSLFSFVLCCHKNHKFSDLFEATYEDYNTRGL